MFQKIKFQEKKKQNEDSERREKKFKIQNLRLNKATYLGIFDIPKSYLTFGIPD